MRIKKDKTTWRASGIIKRDSAQDKSFDGVEGQNPNRKKRFSKKKWCKGKEGKKHDLAWTEESKLGVYMKFVRQTWGKQVNFVNVESKDVICKNCGKILEFLIRNRKLWKLDPNELYNKD